MAKTKSIKKESKKSGGKKSKKTKKEIERLWLVFPTKLVKEPVTYNLGKKFDLVTNIRQVTTTEEIGLVCLEVKGLRKNIDKGIRWMEKKGIKAKPVEINVIDG